MENQTFIRGVYASLLLLLSISVQALEVPGPLVDSGWLKENLDNVLVLDVRKDTKSFTQKHKKMKTIAGLQSCGGKKGSGIHVKGHIPGAILVNWKTVRVKRMMVGREVKKLIPAKADFETFMQSHGARNDTAIIISNKGAASDDATFATRLYWQLKYYGFSNMAILNGGTAAWAADGNELSSEETSASTGDFVATAERTDLLASADDVRAAMQAGAQIIDARTEDYYLGTEQKDYVYAKGHISGAKNLPHTLIVEGKTAARFLPTSQLDSLMSAKGIDTIAQTITYCDSGHLSTGQWFIMHELMGNENVRLYDGSMHDWTQDESNKVTAMKME